MSKRRKSTTQKRGKLHEKKTPDELMDWSGRACQEIFLAEKKQVEQTLGVEHVCLVNRALIDHEVIQALFKSQVFRIREANLDHATFLLAAEKTAFLVVGRELHLMRHMSRIEMETFVKATRRKTFIEAVQKAKLLRSNFSKGVVLVLNNLELFKSLSLELFDEEHLDLLCCNGPEEALAHIKHYLVQPNPQVYQKQIQELCQNEIVERRVMQQIPYLPLAPQSRMQPSDVHDLLAGRTSDNICQEHYNWTPEQARLIQAAIQNDSLVEH